MNGTSAYGVSESVPVGAVVVPVKLQETAPVETDTAAAPDYVATPEPPATANISIPAANGETANVTASSVEAPSVAPPAEQQTDPLLEAFELQHAAVKADPSDFSKWVSLISASEKLVSTATSVD